MHINRLYVIVFILITCTPGIYAFLKFVQTQNVHNISSSNSSLKPESNVFHERTLGRLSNIKRQIHQRFNRDFVLRNESFDIFYFIKHDVFRVNPLPGDVVCGTDGWLFLGDKYGNVIRESKGIEEFSPGEVSQIVENVRNRKDWLQQQGIDYYLIVPPNKHSVYGQHLPILKSRARTKLQQLIAALPQDLHFVSFPHSIKKDDIRLFHKTNSHWNDYGAYLFYVELMKKIRKSHRDAQLRDISDFELYDSISFQEDLTKLLRTHEREVRILMRYKGEEKAIRLPKTLSIPENYETNPDHYETRFSSKSNDIKILLFGDSFSPYLVKFLRESVGEILFIWDQKFDKALILDEKPDIVIDEIVERNLEKLINAPN